MSSTNNNKENKKLPISAIVTGFNEEHFIKDCLESLSFCDEIIYVDLGSSDSTMDIAKKTASLVYENERVPTVEIIHHKYLNTIKYNWLLILDPDECITEELQTEIIALFDQQIAEDIAVFYMPWIFYFKKKKLKGTFWGEVNKKGILLHKERNIFSPLVHRGHIVKDDYRIEDIKFTGKNEITHYWMNSYSQLFEKHWRYIKAEPKSRYRSGLKTGIKGILTVPFVAFHQSYIEKKGYKDGLRGLFLSFFWAWYETSCLIGLYFYQKNK